MIIVLVNLSSPNLHLMILLILKELNIGLKNHAVWKVLYEENQAKPGKYVLKINSVFVKSTGMVYNENPDNGIAYPKTLAKFSDLF